MKKILIAGANSYIGDSFAEHLSKWPDRYAVEAVGMVDGAWREMDFSRYDVVFHVAAIVHRKEKKDAEALYYAVNTDIPIEVAQKAKKSGCKQFIFMSSMSVYGASELIGARGIITKDTVPIPKSFYGKSKLKAEEGLSRLEDDSFKLAILRPPMIYGRGCKGNYPTLKKLALKLPIFPAIDNQRSMLYIGNLCEFVQKIIDNKESGLYFPQNKEYTCTADMVELIAKAHGKQMRLINIFNPIIRLMGKRLGVVNKAFGNLCYEQDMSAYKEEYCICNLPDSIYKSESAGEKNVWIFNQHTTPPEFGHFVRHYCFGKYLKRAGYNPVVFAGSNPHNSDTQLIQDKSLYKTYKTNGFNYVFVKTCVYGNNKAKRLVSMLQYYFRLKRVTKHFEKPDVIIGSSGHPLAAVAAIKMGRKYGCQSVAEIRDLWPESIVAYDIAKKSNPLIKLLYRLEKWIYTKADKIIFTMEGGRDYIIEKGWDKEHGGPVDLNKIYHINNGVDLEAFDYDREHNTLDDADLDNPCIFKVVYTGSIRRVNEVDRLVYAAELLQDKQNIAFLIYGQGTEKETIEDYCRKKGLTNIHFKGYVDKKHIPYIISKASLNLLQYGNTPILRYGVSMNKSFEYLAAGKPVLSNIAPKYDYIESNGCGVMREFSSSKEYAEAILAFANMPDEEYLSMCKNARETAKQYDFGILTDKLIAVMRIAG